MEHRHLVPGGDSTLHRVTTHKGCATNEQHMQVRSPPQDRIPHHRGSGRLGCLAETKDPTLAAVNFGVRPPRPSTARSYRTARGTRDHAGGPRCRGGRVAAARWRCLEPVVDFARPESGCVRGDYRPVDEGVWVAFLRPVLSREAAERRLRETAAAVRGDRARRPPGHRFASRRSTRSACSAAATSAGPSRVNSGQP